MDRSLTNLAPDLSGADPGLRERVIQGHSAVLSQVEYFRENFGKTTSSWKKDGTRVTVVDETISENLFLPLKRLLPIRRFLLGGRSRNPRSHPPQSRVLLVARPGRRNEQLCSRNHRMRNLFGPVARRHAHLRLHLRLQQGRVAARRSRVRCNRRNEPSPSNHRTGQRKTYLLHAFPHSHRRSRYPASQAHGLGDTLSGFGRHRFGQRRNRAIDGCLEFRPKPWDCACRLPDLRGCRSLF